MKRCPSRWKGWQFASETGIPGLAARTWAITHGLATTPARVRRLALFHAGVIERKSAGRSAKSGAYQPTPKPSPLSGSSRSAERKLCRMSECEGSMRSESSRTGGPR
jgi:hypothetical protein